MQLCAGNFWSCQPSLLVLYINVVIVFGWALQFVWLYRYAADRARQVEVLRACAFGVVMAVVLVAVAVAASVGAGPCAKGVVVFAEACGYIASLVQLVRFGPQLFESFNLQHSGAISKAFYLIQGAGGVVLSAFQILGSHEDFTTWLPQVVANAMQLAIAALAAYRDSVGGKEPSAVVQALLFAGSPPDSPERSSKAGSPFGDVEGGAVAPDERSALISPGVRQALKF